MSRGEGKVCSANARIVQEELIKEERVEFVHDKAMKMCVVRKQLLA
jgi:hypothetical protein